MRFLHLSDLHFHSSNKDNEEANALFGYIADNYPEHNLIITGDIVDDGMEAQCRNAYAALKPLKGRVFICPGNHDFGAAGNFYMSWKADHFDSILSVPLAQSGTFAGENSPVVTVLKDDDSSVMLIALDSNLETINPFDFACGEIGEKQLAELDTILSSPTTGEMVKFVFMHHHPFLVWDWHLWLQDAKELMRTLYGRIDVLLFGHRHRWESWENRGGIQYVLASDNSPGKAIAREIVVTGPDVTVNEVPIEPVT